MYVDLPRGGPRQSCIQSLRVGSVGGGETGRRWFGLTRKKTGAREGGMVRASAGGPRAIRWWKKTGSRPEVAGLPLPERRDPGATVRCLLPQCPENTFAACIPPAAGRIRRRSGGLPLPALPSFASKLCNRRAKGVGKRAGESRVRATFACERGYERLPIRLFEMGHRKGARWRGNWVIRVGTQCPPVEERGTRGGERRTRGACAFLNSCCRGGAGAATIRQSCGFTFPWPRQAQPMSRPAGRCFRKVRFCANRTRQPHYTP